MASIPVPLDYEFRHGMHDPISKKYHYQREECTYEEISHYQSHVAYQNTNLWNFDIDLLETSGCFSKSPILPFDLEFMHPIFGVNNWLPMAECEDIGSGIPGKWDVYTHHKVKDVVLPILHLASNLLLATVLSPWYDALLFGPRTVIDPTTFQDDCPSTDGFYSISSIARRDPLLVAKDGGRRAAYCARFGYFVQFDIRADVGSIPGTERHVKGSYQGFGRVITASDGTKSYAPKGLILIAAKTLLPFFKSNMSPSEILVQRWLVAKTIVHELMHSHSHNSMAIKDPPRRNEAAEPYFETEEISEIGRSWENFIFAGEMESMHSRQPADLHLPHLGGLWRTYPSFSRFSDGKYKSSSGTRYRTPEKFQDGSWFDAFPVPIIYFEDSTQKEFWNVSMIKYGLQVLVPPHLLGMRVTKSGQKYKYNYMRGGQDFMRYIDTNNNTRSTTISMGKTAAITFMEKQAHRLHVEILNSALRRNAQKKRADDVPNPDRLLLLQKAVDTSDLDTQYVFLTEAKNAVANKNVNQAGQISAILASSSTIEIKFEAFLLATDLKSQFSKVDRIASAQYAIAVAQNLVDQGTHDYSWNMALDAAKLKLAEIQAG